MDRNTKHLDKFFGPTGTLLKDAPIDYIHFTFPPSDATKDLKRKALEKINLVWNSFVSATKSPRWGQPYQTLVFDTAPRLWDGIYPIKNELQIDRLGDKKSAMNFMDANAWMQSLTDVRADLRPEANLVFIVGEEPTWEQDEKGQWVANERKPRMDAWKRTKQNCRLYLRLYRRAAGPDRDYERSGGKKGVKDKRNVRYGQVLKCSDDESFLSKAEELAEPTWADLKEIMEAASGSQ